MTATYPVFGTAIIIYIYILKEKVNIKVWFGILFSVIGVVALNCGVDSTNYDYF